MVHPIVPSLAVAAIGLIGARLGDLLLNPVFTNCRKNSSAVVWKYDEQVQTAANKPHSAARRVVSRSLR